LPQRTKDFVYLANKRNEEQSNSKNSSAEVVFF